MKTLCIKNLKTENLDASLNYNEGREGGCTLNAWSLTVFNLGQQMSLCRTILWLLRLNCMIPLLNEYYRDHDCGNSSCYDIIVRKKKMLITASSKPHCICALWRLLANSKVSQLCFSLLTVFTLYESNLLSIKPKKILKRIFKWV